MSGVAADVQQILHVLNLPGEYSGRVYHLLQKCCYSSETAIETFIQDGWPRDAPPLPQEMDRGPRSKRPRTSVGGATGGSSSSDGLQPETVPEPGTALPPVFAQAVEHDKQTQAVLGAINGLSQQLANGLRLDSALSSAIQAALPQALLEAEIIREREKQTLAAHKANGDLAGQLSASKSMLDLGKIEGLTYNARDNTIECTNCLRYSAFAPATLRALRGNHHSTGVWEGTRPADSLIGQKAREFKTVRLAVQRHLESPWHEWYKSHTAPPPDMSARRAHPPDMSARGARWPNLVIVHPIGVMAISQFS